MIASPLNRLLKKKEKFERSDQCQHSFEKLKTVLIEAPMLAQPEPGTKYTVYTYAYLNGLGCVLM